MQCKANKSSYGRGVRCSGNLLWDLVCKGLMECVRSAGCEEQLLDFGSCLCGFRPGGGSKRMTDRVQKKEEGACRALFFCIQ